MTDRDPRIPVTEKLQPDPQLQLSHGRASGLQITIIAIACIFILGLMIYGLGRPATDGSVIASSPPAQETTGAAPATPQAGGNVPAGENAAPKGDAPAKDAPAGQPAPQQTKPGVTEDDSKR
jgi:hypothetical protein